MFILEDVSLCAIVRDEMMNPAGGIERFLRAHLPHVSNAVVVDTGSIDGTRDKLAELEREYPHLRVFDHKFDGFGPSRNVSLSKVVTKYALILDADELLTPEDFENLKKNIRNYFSVYLFEILSIDFNGEEIIDPCCLKTRLIESNQRFVKVLQEYLAQPLDTNSTSWINNARIKHFLPSDHGLGIKRRNHYGQFESFKYLTDGTLIVPSQTKDFTEWKVYNPQRDKYPN